MISPSPARLAIVGRGRLGVALAGSLRRAGYDVVGPLARAEHLPVQDPVDAALLCVPDGEIATAAATIAEQLRALTDGGRCRLIGHCCGALGLEALPIGEGLRAFSLHPLMTVPAADPQQRFDGAAAAVDGSDACAAAFARMLALDLGMVPVEVGGADRAAYHAAASIASNFLITLEVAAERLASTAGVTRELLAPLVRQSVENWVAGGERALTGPIVRGDEGTVALQRAAVEHRAPELLDLFDALAAATAELAGARGALEAVA